MSLTRLLLHLTRPALVSLLLLLAAVGAQAAQVDYFLKIPDIPGESNASQVPAAALEIQPFAETPLIGLLLPAVQKAREAAARPSFARLACEATVIPEATIEFQRRGDAEPFLSYQLRDLVVTSVGLRGGAGNDTLLGNRGNDHALGQDGNDLLIVNNGDGSDFLELVELSFGAIEWIDPASGERIGLDCSRGACECDGR